MEALERAIEIIGGVPRLADLLGIERQAIYQWKQTPVKRVLDIEEATDIRVTRYELRPDIYGEPPQQVA